MAKMQSRKYKSKQLFAKDTQNFLKDNMEDNKIEFDRTDYEQLVEKIKQTRIDYGISQESLAKAAHVTRNSISHMEKGRVKTKQENILKMCRAMDITVHVKLTLF
ncbi:XRE family transcriptional regulator [Apilactobacillus timberlakei]|uniref:helix-turn-helix transcriptional regulator n=1 Tax=Apilactobacillus timberlakei TaxID=2008380 RepID=UPI001126F698|nr:helix-turn-helix transcriptional regulator [Apilactobacillus timberlakei]TPR13031.1 XRE family transcriptional regulator [Apilactobacillus timberlakei]